MTKRFEKLWHSRSFRDQQIFKKTSFVTRSSIRQTATLVTTKKVHTEMISGDDFQKKAEQKIETEEDSGQK